jgi:Ni/Fe-hydrogenase subunit HybB-like protein
MTNEILNAAQPLISHVTHVDGYVYPNEQTLLWSTLIVVYPYIAGLVAGAFILASLVRVFDVKALEPAYRLALLTAMAFLICAPLPLLLHLGHPERCFEVMMTPHVTSPMAMFGFVYAWYHGGIAARVMVRLSQGFPSLWSRSRAAFAGCSIAC